MRDRPQPPSPSQLQLPTLRTLSAWLVALCLLLGPACAGARADEIVSSYPIACRLELAGEPGLTEPLEEGIRQAVERAFEVVLGSGASLRFLDRERDAPWWGVPIGSVEAATLAPRWNGRERLLLLSLSRDGNLFVASAREYDPRFQSLSPVFEHRAAQRELVPDAAVRAVLRAFTPLAEVRSVRGREVRIEFPGAPRLHLYRGWLGLDGELGFELWREVAGGRAGSAAAATVRLARSRRSFLALRSWTPEGAECELIGADTELFKEPEAGSLARHLARPAQGGAAGARVQVVRKGTRQPQEGCAVFVSTAGFSSDPGASRGVTDREGMLPIPLETRGVVYVSVQYKDLILKSPLLAGTSPDPLVFEVPTRGRRADFVRRLDRLHEELRDQRRVDIRILQELNEKAKAKETAEVRRLVAEGTRERVSPVDAESRIGEIEIEARAAGEDVSHRADMVRATAREATQPFDLAAYATWSDDQERLGAVRGLVEQINERQRDMDWAALPPLYERLLELEPNNREYTDQLRRLRNDLRVRGTEHERARRFVDEELRQISARDLGDRWPAVERETGALIAAKDHLSLLKVQRSLTAWSTELAAETRGLVEEVKGAAGDPDRTRSVVERREKLEELHESITKLYGRVRDYLKPLGL